MTFKPLPGNQGMIYVPDSETGKKKAPVPGLLFLPVVRQRTLPQLPSQYLLQKKKKKAFNC